MKKKLLALLKIYHPDVYQGDSTYAHAVTLSLIRWLKEYQNG